MQKNTLINNKGFTIVELMIATTVFSMVLIVCAFAIIQVGRMYYKGTITTSTQVASRKFGEDVSQAIQFGSRASGANQFIRLSPSQSMTNGTQTVNAVANCIGDVRYTYVIGKPQGAGANDSKYVLWKDRNSVVSPCVPVNITSAQPTTVGESMLGDRMRLAKFSTTDVNGLYNISITVSYGDSDDLFEAATVSIPEPFGICKGVNAGGQFCAVSRYNTVVGKRL